jgi:hypothetical protein
VLSGTASLDELALATAALDGFDTEAVTFPDAVIVQSLFEMHHRSRQSTLPPSLHPTNPPTFVLQFWHCPQSPWGAFRLAQGRVGCRSGLRPRGLVQGAICDNPEATDALRRRWGLPVQLGAVTVQRRYDAVHAAASLGAGSPGASHIAGGARPASTVVALHATDPEPLGANDVAYTTSLALADTPRGSRLVQVDVDVAADRAERLRPRLEQFDAAAWVHPDVSPYHPVSASVVLGALTIQRLRFVSRPGELAFTGTETLGDER